MAIVMVRGSQPTTATHRERDRIESGYSVSLTKTTELVKGNAHIHPIPVLILPIPTSLTPSGWIRVRFRRFMALYASMNGAPSYI